MALRIAHPAPVSPRFRSGARRAAFLPKDAGHATEVLYDVHGGTVFKYAWHLLGRREDAEDATQATFLAAHSALAGGTAVLEPGAWVLRIARNECMGRLRRIARAPGMDALGADLDPAAEGGVEAVVALRDEMRTAQRTLSEMPELEREAFVLHEWIGLETDEVALALGVAPGEVDALAARARRSLVLAVGGLEPAIGCAATRAALEAGPLDRAGKVHLLRCPVCRGVRRALRPRDPASGTPGALVAGRLAIALPGFGIGGGGAAAALTAKAAATPFVMKAVAVVATAVLAGGALEQAVSRSHPAHDRSTGGAFGRGGEAGSGAALVRNPGNGSVALVVPTATARDAGATSRQSVSRGGAADTQQGDSGAAGASGDGAHGSAVGGNDGEVGAAGPDTNESRDRHAAGAGGKDGTDGSGSARANEDGDSPGGVGESHGVTGVSAESGASRSDDDEPATAPPATHEDDADAAREPHHGGSDGDGGEGDDATPEAPVES